MTWEDIPGYFDWPSHTDAVVESAPPGAILVEVGVLFGRSLAYLAAKAGAAAKGLRVVGVDTFLGSPELYANDSVLVDGRPLAECPVGTIAGGAVYHLYHAGALRDVAVVVSDSVAAASLFADRSVWSVYIDGDHSEAACRADILAWWPKVVAGGWLSGHDYGDFPGVTAAVDALVPGRRVSGSTWWVRVGV